MGAELRIESSTDGLTLAGDIDAHTASHLESAVDSHFAANGASLALSMQDVSFMDSSGLRVVLAATETARGRGGDLVLCRPRASVRRLVEVTGLAGHLTMDPVEPST